MWALGCVIYELLTGEILFDCYHDENECNDERYHLYSIASNIGMIPNEMMKQSKNKDIYFSHDMKRIKGYKSININHKMWETLSDVCDKNNVDPKMKTEFINFMNKIFTHDKKNRMTSKEAMGCCLFA